MRIANNIMAMNAHRQLMINQGGAAKSIEKLSSGLRINRAGDDAAGLAISEKMRGQIRGLRQAMRNAQDGISLIQTAEGALNETHAILQRMRELANQAANGTLTPEDRQAIVDEVENLKAEIDRIGNTTEFNTLKLIDGSLRAQKSAGTKNASVMGSQLGERTAAVLTAPAAPNAANVQGYTGTQATITIDGARITFATDADVYKAFSDGGNVDTAGLAAQLQEDINAAIEAYNVANGTNIAKVSVSASAAQDGTISITSGSVGATSTISVEAGAAAADNLWTNVVGFADGQNYFEEGLEGAYSVAGAATVGAIDSDDTLSVTVDGTTIQVTLAKVGELDPEAGDDMSGLANALEQDINNAIDAYNDTVPSEQRLEHVSVSIKDGSLVVESGSSEPISSIKFGNDPAARLLGLDGQSSASQGGGLWFQIGANSGQTMQIVIEDMRSDALGVADVDMSTREGASEALDKIDAAINAVSRQRSALGAYQNRLEHTIANLGASAENLQAAESRIRDVDMAQEMMNFTKYQILQQASTAMLAQANLAPQSVLQLLG